MSQDVKRSVRVAGRVREELSVLLRDLSDPRLAGVLITRVEASDDLSFLKVFVRCDTGADSSRQRGLQRGLEAATGRLRRDLTRNVGLRVAPQLRFLYDEGIDAQLRVEELLHEIARERSSGGESGSG
jgi:ribosome-binding factor A